MFTILPFILIIGSLTAIIIIVVRNYPQLTLLDVDTISEAKQVKKKNEFIKKRADKKVTATKTEWKKRFSPVVSSAKQHQLTFRKYVGKIQKTVEEEVRRREKGSAPKINKEQAKDKITSLLHEAARSLDHHEYHDAEKHYINIIRLDGKHKDAYKGLGDVYYAQGQYVEAEQTYQFLAKLDKNNDVVFAKLADVAEENKDYEAAAGYLQRAVELNGSKPARFSKLADMLEKTGNSDAALEAIGQAVDIEPENPKYLDKFLEISIIVGDKKLANKVYQQLRRVNPENKKLPVFKEKIANL
jgi:tetratricopeptide (TPR) repeat protein